MVAGRISKPEAAIFLPAIRDWAKSTNNHAAAYATNFLASWHLSLSADQDRDKLAQRLCDRDL